jgi:membrane protein implicated in regulation of membrane protease activity
MTRTLIGRNFGFGTRERVFESEDAIEVDATDQYELSRKRVLFEDVALITYHREYGWAFLSVQTFVAIVFLAIAEVTYAAGGGWIPAMIISVFALPSIVAIFLRVTLQVDVISIFGRRSRATIRFSFQKKKARELYGRLCHRTRQMQKQIEDANREIENGERASARSDDESWRAEARPTDEEQESIG